MNKEDDNIIKKINNYLDELLSEADSIAFEDEMDSDPFLEKKVKAVKLERMAEKMLLYRYIKDDLQTLSSTLDDRLPDPLWWRYRWSLGIAMLSMAFGLFYYLLPNHPSEKTNTEIFIQPPPAKKDSINTTQDTTLIAQQPINHTTDNRLAMLLEKQQRTVQKEYIVYDFKDDKQKGQNQDRNLSLYEQAVQAYNTGKMQQVLKLLERPESGQEIMSSYLRAHAYFKIGDYRKAADNFQVVATQSKSDVLDHEKAQWYELLSRLCFQKAQDTAVQRLFRDIEQNPQHLFLKETHTLKENLSQKK